MHDSQVSEWGGIYSKREKHYRQYDGKIVFYLAFDKSRYNLMIKSAQHESLAERPVEVNLLRPETFFRQAVEWGGCIFQVSFPQMEDRFIYEEIDGWREMVLAADQIFNVRTKYKSQPVDSSVYALSRHGDQVVHQSVISYLILVFFVTVIK